MFARTDGEASGLGGARPTFAVSFCDEFLLNRNVLRSGVLNKSCVDGAFPLAAASPARRAF